MTGARRGLFTLGRTRVLLVLLLVLNLGYAEVAIVLEYGREAEPPPDAAARFFPDFAAFWAAAVMTIEGTPELAYDMWAHREVEMRGLGFRADTWMLWHYPPHFQLAVTPLGFVPYWGAMALWIGLTLALFLWTVWRILPNPLAILGALAAAPTGLILINGQTGFLTGALMGMMLLDLARRPGRAGIALGLLTFKPQLGLALPFVLAAAGRWRVLAVATATAVGALALSWAVLGAETWIAFAASIPDSAAMFNRDYGRFEIYASFYGWLRHAGVEFPYALAAHAILGLVVLAATMMAWRRADLAFPVKAALLCYAAVIVTPRVLHYDLHILVIGALFQLRHAIEVGFFRAEREVIAAVLAFGLFLTLTYPIVTWTFAPALFAACWLGRVRGRAGAGPALSAR